MSDFRCAAEARARGDELAGTASTVRGFLLLEHAGPWGVDALRDARLPDGLGAHLRAASRRHGVRVLLARRPGRHCLNRVGGPTAPSAHHSTPRASRICSRACAASACS